MLLPSPPPPAPPLLHPPAPAASQIDSLAWVAPAAMLVSSKLLVDGAEESFAPLGMLTWQGDGLPAPGTSALAEFFALNVAEGVEEQGPWLQAATVPQVTGARRRAAPPAAHHAALLPSPAAPARAPPRSPRPPAHHPRLATNTNAGQWGATVYAHRKASDDHVKAAVLVWAGRRWPWMPRMTGWPSASLMRLVGGRGGWRRRMARGAAAQGRSTRGEIAGGWGTAVCCVPPACVSPRAPPATLPP